MVKNLFNENFYEKRKKKQLMFRQLFLFFIKIVLKFS